MMELAIKTLEKKAKEIKELNIGSPVLKQLQQELEKACTLLKKDPTGIVVNNNGRSKFIPIDDL